MTPAARNSLIVVFALLAVAGGFMLFLFGNLGENLVYYWSPSELMAQGQKAYGPTIRLGGVVKPDTVEWAPDRASVRFRVSDSHAPESPSVQVLCEQTPPQMFRPGIGVVVEGTFDASQVFKTQRLMVNHSNEYRPPKPGEKPADWKGSVSEAKGEK